MKAQRWNTFGEWIDFASAVSPDLSGIRGDNKWAGGTFQEAIKLALNGWTEGVEQVKRMSTPIIDRVTSLIERPVFNYDVEGQSLDVGTYLNGDPECFLRQSTETVEGFSTQHLTLCVNVAVSGSVNPQTMIERGVLLTSLVEALEFAGRRVELWFGVAVQGSGGHYDLFARIKSAEQSIDTARLVYCLAHPSSLRRMWFSTLEQASHDRKITDKLSPAVATIKNDVNIDGILSSNGCSPDKAVKMILDILTAQGVQLTQ